MSNVYCIVEPIRMEYGEPVPLFDLTPAAKYGEIKFLLKNNSSILNTVPLVRALKEKLSEYTKDDYILPVGDPVIIGLVSAMISEKTGGVFKVLKWDKKERVYLPVQIDISGRSI